MKLSALTTATSPDPRTCRIDDFPDFAAMVARRQALLERRAELEARRADLRSAPELEMEAAVEAVLAGGEAPQAGRGEELDSLRRQLEVLDAADFQLRSQLREIHQARSDEMNSAIAPQLRTLVRRLGRKLYETADAVRAIGALREDLGVRGALLSSALMEGLEPYIEGGRWYGAHSSVDAWLGTMERHGFIKPGEDPRRFDEAPPRGVR